MAKKWIQGVHMKKGALRATAKRAGMISGGQSLSAEDLDKLARSKNPKTAKRARFGGTTTCNLTMGAGTYSIATFALAGGQR